MSYMSCNRLLDEHDAAGQGLRRRRRRRGAEGAGEEEIGVRFAVGCEADDEVAVRRLEVFVLIPPRVREQILGYINGRELGEVGGKAAVDVVVLFECLSDCLDALQGNGLACIRYRREAAGEGAERASLEALAANSGIGGAVEFLGWLSPEQLDEPLSRAWAAVVPSLWAEPHGLVAAEAIVRGTPVLCSASGGLGEIVEDGVTGLNVFNAMT